MKRVDNYKVDTFSYNFMKLDDYRKIIGKNLIKIQKFRINVGPIVFVLIVVLKQL